MNDRAMAYFVGAAVAAAGIILALSVDLRGPAYPFGFILLVLYFSAVVTSSVLGQAGRTWVSLGEPFRAAAVMLHGAVVYEATDIATSWDLVGTGAEYVWFMTLAYLVAMDMFCWHSANKRKHIYYTPVSDELDMKELVKKLKASGLKVRTKKEKDKTTVTIEAAGGTAVLTTGRKRGRHILLLDNSGGGSDILRATQRALREVKAQRTED